MKKISVLLYTIFVIVSCNETNQRHDSNSDVSAYEEIVKDDYQLTKPSKKSNAILILFGGFHQKPADIKKEFKILETAKKHKVTVLFMNYNQKLWLTAEDRILLKESIEEIFTTHKLSTDNIYIGGFSSGGNITLLLSDYLVSSKSRIQPKGLFVVDAPVDLLELYRLSQRNITRNFSEVSIQEASWLINILNNELGNPENGIEKYETFSPYTFQTGKINKLSNLDGLDIRFYSEPDTVWWKENRQNESTDLNAHWIEKLSIQLKKELPKASIQYVITENKGYSANGDRHPHSWSIVDKKDLIDWVIKK